MSSLLQQHCRLATPFFYFFSSSYLILALWYSYFNCIIFYQFGCDQEMLYTLPGTSKKFEPLRSFRWCINLYVPSMLVRNEKVDIMMYVWSGQSLGQHCNYHRVETDYIYAIQHIIFSRIDLLHTTILYTMRVVTKVILWTSCIKFSWEQLSSCT